MALNFPATPADNDTYAGYIYNATKGVWQKQVTTTDGVVEGSTNLYFTDQRAIDATASSYDTLGSAATAESNANTYTDTRESAITTAYQTYADTAESDAVSTANAYTDTRETAITTAYQSYADTAEADAIAAAATDATTKANTAESNAESYTDSLIGDVTVDGTGGNTVTDRIASAVSALVDAAPTTLDTLNELAAALGDDPNFATTVSASIGEKVAKSGDTMTGFLTLSSDPTSNLHAATKQYVDTAEADAISAAATDATTKANTAESNANTYTDNAITALDTDAVSEGSTNLYFTNARAISAVTENIGITDLSDVVTTGANAPSDGQALIYNNATSSWIPGEAGTTINSINDISDVNTSAKTNGYVLTYNGTSSQWEAAAPTGGTGGTADDNAIFKATLFFGGRA